MSAKLAVGCGYKPTPGYVRVDINPNIPDLDWCGDAADTMPWPDETFDEISAVDILEHIPYTRTMDALKEWARLLKPGGRLFIQTPDAEAIFRSYLRSPRSMVAPHLTHLPPLVSVAWRLMGGHFDGEYTREGDDWRNNAHYALFDRKTLVWYLAQTGFRVVSITTNSFPNLQCWAEKQ
jgi:predicted SAM-dependent methyltransferase